MVTLLSVHSVLPYGTGAAAVRTAERIYANGTLALFVSAIFAGALITSNFSRAAAGNIVGGVGLVTLNRLTQGRSGARSRASA